MITQRIKTPVSLLALAACLVWSIPAPAARPKLKATNPDLTQGEKIPDGYTHTWTLGATGARGWMFTDRLTTSDARQIAITAVAKGSPAEGILEIGDVILGVGGKPFSYDPRTEFGKALTAAESTAGAGDLTLIRWRAGKAETVVLNLPVLGDYSATAPYNCPKSKRIFDSGCQALAKRMESGDYPRTQSPVTRSLNALALLASGNPEYLPLIRREVQWASEFSADSMKTWYYGYVTMLVAEYQMATGDQTFMPGLRRLALESAHGQSGVGSWGHKFARPDGLLPGYGMMNAPGVPLTTSMVMARAAGVDDPVLATAIERSAKLLRFYNGKGSVPYGDHAPWIETHEDNGKNGMAAILFNQLEEKEPAAYFSRMSLASHGSERDCGHTGNFWNMLWAVPGVAQSGPWATGAWMAEFGSWYFDLARAWDGSFPHQGPPEPSPDATGDWDATGAYLIAYAMPLQKIMLTGKRPGKVPPLDAATAYDTILDGRGWNNKDRVSFYDKLTEPELLQRLQSWSPVVRERAAMAMARRKFVPMEILLTLLDSPELDARRGACQALKHLKEASAPAIPALRKALKAEDLWLRIEAAYTLAAIGAPARGTIPELLELLSKVDPENDPRGMQQRYLCFALFDANLLGRSLDGVDRGSLYKAVRAGLKNEDGRARSSLASVYRNLTIEEIKPLLPAILQAVNEPAPSGEMFSDGIRMEGLKVLATHRVEDGIKACVDYLSSQNPWGSEKRTAEILDILVTYGARAKPFLPTLNALAMDYSDGEPDFPNHLSLQKEADVRAAIKTIEASSELPELIRISTAPNP